MPHSLQLAGPMMCRRAGFHAHKVGRKLCEEADHLGPTKFTLYQHCTVEGDRRHLKLILRQIDPTLATSCSMARLLDVDLKQPHHLTGPKYCASIPNDVKACSVKSWRLFVLGNRGNT